MSLDTGLIDWVAEAMAAQGVVTWRRMMGGATLYLDGTIFAIVGEGALWFKADATSDAEWDALAAERMSMVDKNGRTMSMNYRRAPDDCYDDADALRERALKAVAAGRRAAK